MIFQAFHHKIDLVSSSSIIFDSKNRAMNFDCLLLLSFFKLLFCVSNVIFNANGKNRHNLNSQSSIVDGFEMISTRQYSELFVVFFLYRFVQALLRLFCFSLEGERVKSEMSKVNAAQICVIVCKTTERIQWPNIRTYSDCVTIFTFLLCFPSVISISFRWSFCSFLSGTFLFAE